MTNKYTSGWDWLTATYHLGALEAYQATGNIEYYNRTYDLAENYGRLVYNGDKSTVCDAISTAQEYCITEGPSICASPAAVRGITSSAASRP